MMFERPNQSAAAENGMATSTIKQVTNTSGSNYCKMPDGTLICTGNANIPIGNTSPSKRGEIYVYALNTSINFPVTFENTPTVIVSKGAGQVGSIGWVRHDRSGISEIDVMTGVNTFTSEQGFVVQWIAIGRWK